MQRIPSPDHSETPEPGEQEQSHAPTSVRPKNKNELSKRPQKTEEPSIRDANPRSEISKENRETRETRENKESKETRETRENRETRDSRDTRDKRPRETRETRESQLEPLENRESSEESEKPNANPDNFAFSGAVSASIPLNKEESKRTLKSSRKSPSARSPNPGPTSQVSEKQPG